VDLTQATKLLTSEKTSYSDIDTNSFPFYMVNRILSMDMSYLPILNEIAVECDMYMDNESKYRLLHNVLPNKNRYTKLIKSNKKTTIIDKIVNCISIYYSCNKTTAEEYYQIILTSERLEDDIIDILLYCGYEYKESLKTFKELKKCIT